MALFFFGFEKADGRLTLFNAHREGRRQNVSKALFTRLDAHTVLFCNREKIQRILLDLVFFMKRIALLPYFLIYREMVW